MMTKPFLELFLLFVSVGRTVVVASTNQHLANNHRRLNPTTCTSIPDGADAFDNAAHEATPLRNEETDCLVSGTGGWHDYPHMLEQPSFVEMCVSLDNSTRYIFSNGVPNHSIHSPPERPKHCTVPYAVSMPNEPLYDDSYMQENPVAGPLGFALNGVPFVDAAWAVDNGFLFEDAAWNGHTNTVNFYWHYHSSRMPPTGEYPGENELVGYAMDGFPIYGPMTDNTLLDECNGHVVDGKYRYQMVRMEDIDFGSPQCNEADPRVHNWNPIIGCFHGSTSQSRVSIDDGNRQGMVCSTLSTPPPDLASCLKDISGDHVVVMPDDLSYANASSCHNSARADRTWSPRAIIKVTSPEQVAAAVTCASLSSVTVTARSGAHGFENEACSGELIVDVTNLNSLSVDTSTKIVEFGAGHLHGQLYRKLLDYGLVVPGGTENTVGTAGLWLGCGRGPLTQVHGLSCDSILGIEFVDAMGNIRVADSTTNTDMFWMAKGSGGEFPGVVTKFIVQSYDMPVEVWEIKMTFESNQVKPLIKEWAARIDTISDPSRQMFTNIHSYLGSPILSMSCYDCTEEQKEWTKTQFDEISAVAGGESNEISYWAGTWLDRLLKEDWDDYENESDLLKQYEWPEVWSALGNGAHMVPSTEASDEMLTVIQDALETRGDGFFLFIYSMTGPGITSVPLTETAYGGREAKYVVHYKFVGSDTNEVKLPLRDVSIALDQAGLPCKGFYNYADREFPCAAESGDLWLEAHFSDVARMKTIKETEDPDDLFMSTLKAKKWRKDPNEHLFLGWPDIGDWGGTCTCPNGEVYWVGDNANACESLACIGGTAGSCSEKNPGAGYRTVCATAPPTVQPTPFPTPAPVILEPSSTAESGTPASVTRAPSMQTETELSPIAPTVTTPAPQSEGTVLAEPTITSDDLSSSRPPSIPSFQSAQLSSSATNMTVSSCITVLAMVVIAVVAS